MFTGGKMAIKWVVIIQSGWIWIWMKLETTHQETREPSQKYSLDCPFQCSLLVFYHNLICEIDGKVIILEFEKFDI